MEIGKLLKPLQSALNGDFPTFSNASAQRDLLGKAEKVWKTSICICILFHTENPGMIPLEKKKMVLILNEARNPSTALYRLSTAFSDERRVKISAQSSSHLNPAFFHYIYVCEKSFGEALKMFFHFQPWPS
jgi:hypothetical protein